MTNMVPNILQAKRFSYFAVLWAIFGYFDHICNPSWFLLPASQLHLAFIIFVLCRPSSMGAFLGLIISEFIHVSCLLEDAYNHMLLEWFIDGAILATLIVYLTSTRFSLSRSAFYISLAPILRLFLLGMYLFAFLAKLNIDFLNPSVSCASQMFHDLRTGYAFSLGWTKIFPWIDFAIILLVLVLELLLPILLTFSKTCKTGIVLGLTFHFLLGLEPKVPIFSFTSMVLALYFVFLPDNDFLIIDAAVSCIGKWITRIISTFSIRIFIIVLVIYLPALLTSGLPNRHGTWFPLWLLFFSFMIFLSMMSFFQKYTPWRCPPMPLQDIQCFRPSTMHLSLLILPFLLNGFAPYFGVKTQRSLTMFSNLRIGWRDNSLIFPESWVISKQDLVQIISSNDPLFQRYVQDKYLLTALEFRRLFNKSSRKDLFISCFFMGKRIIISKPALNKSIALTRPLSWGEKYFISFKPIDASPQCRCQW